MKMLATCCFVVFAWGTLPAIARPVSQCSELLSVQLPVPDGASSLRIDRTRLVPAKRGVPEHCLVHGHIDREINFAIALPTTWNGKIMMEGNGGFAGSIPTWALDYYASYHYAAVGTDMGQTGDPADLLNHPGRQANFLYRSTHLVALSAKEVTKAYYGTSSTHAYFEGCSRGGVQGMLEASRYPDDFDGIIAGSPNLPNNAGARTWNEQAVFPGGPLNGGLITSSKVALLSKAVLRKCDKLDGVTDGVVADPRICNFSPMRNLPRCANDVDGPKCFTNAQVAALQKIHEGPQTNGRAVGVPYYFSGNEGYNYGDAFGVGEDILEYPYDVTGFPENPDLFPDLFGLGEPIPSYDYYLETMYLRYLVFSNPNYLIQEFNFDDASDVARYTKAFSPQFPASPDLSKFGRKGGKLIMWHGLADQVVNSELSREFYEAGASAAGGYENIKTFDRLFLVPGTFHCGGGPGPSSFDFVPALEQWLEAGKAPDSVIGWAPDTNTAQPICAYPKQARLKSAAADPGLAESYVCTNVPDAAGDIN